MEIKKYFDLLNAQAEGKTIQVQMRDGSWKDVYFSKLDISCDASFYRIKPNK